MCACACVEICVCTASKAGREGARPPRPTAAGGAAEPGGERGRGEEEGGEAGRQRRMLLAVLHNAER